MVLEFTITVRDHRVRDMVVIKLDMLRFEGYWSGYVVNPRDSQRYEIELYPGLVEVGDSIF